MSVMLRARYFKWYVTGFHKVVFGCSALKDMGTPSSTCMLIGTQKG